MSRSIVRFVADLLLAMLILLDLYIYMYMYVRNSRLYDQYTRKCLGFLIDEEGIGRLVRVGRVVSVVFEMHCVEICKLIVELWRVSG